MKVNLKAERKDDLVIVSIISSNVRLCLSDETNLQRFVDEMMALVTKEQPNLVLDCHNLDYITSAALGKFVSMNKKLQKAGGCLAFCNMKRDVYEVFETTKLHTVFKIRRAEMGGTGDKEKEET